VLEHQQPVSNADAQGSAGAAFTDDRRQDRYPQFEHLPQIHGDRFALSLFFSQQTGVGTRGVDEAEDRQPEAIRVLHQSHRLAIAPWGGHAEIAGDVFLGVPTFLVAEQDDTLVSDAAHATDEGLVVAATAVPMQFDELIGKHLDVIEGARSLGVPRDLNLLRGAQVAEDLLATACREGLELEQLLADVDFRVLGQLPDLVDLLLQLHQGLLEVEQGTTGHGSGCKGQALNRRA